MLITLSTRNRLCGIPDFDRHLFPQHRERCLDLFSLCGVLRIEHPAHDALMNTQSSGQFRIADALVAHGQVQGQFRRQPQRYGIRRWPRLGAEGDGISSWRDKRIDRSEPSASMASSIASRSSLPSVATRGRLMNSTRTRPSLPALNLAGYANADIEVPLTDHAGKHALPSPLCPVPETRANS